MAGPNSSTASNIVGPLSTGKFEQAQYATNEKEKKDIASKDENKLKEQERLTEERAFNLQCFFVNYMEDFSKRKSDDTNVKYNSFAIVNGYPGNVLQELLCKKGVESLFNLTSAQKALMVPKIQIFKIVYGKNSSVGKDIALPFKSHMVESEISDITKSKKGRGDDVLIKGFSYEMVAKDVGQEGQVTCVLSLYFSNANSFLEKREGVSFSDLVFDKDSVSPSGTVYNSKKYRTKIVIGWAIPTDPKGILFSQETIKAIGRSTVVLYVTRTGEDIEFADDGSLRVSIRFVGALEGVMSDNVKANVFSKSEAGLEAENRKKKILEQEKKEIQERKDSGEADPKIDNKPKRVLDKCKTVIRQDPTWSSLLPFGGASGGKIREATICETKEIPNEKEIEKNNIAELEALDKQEKYSRIVRQLFDNSRMYYVDIDESMVKAFSDEERKAIKVRLAAEGNKSYLKNVIKEEIQERELNKKAFAVRDKIVRVISDQDQNRLEYIRTVTEDAIKKTHEFNGSFKDYKYQSKTLEGKEKNKIKTTLGKQISSSTTWKNGDKENIRAYFFYFGDLLDILFENYVLKDLDIDNIKILVGTLVYTDARQESKKEIEISIADIPISLERFIAWFSQKVISSQTEIYTVSNFVKDILRDVILGSMGDTCFGVTSKNFPQIQFNSITTTAFGNNEPLYWLQNGDRKNIYEEANKGIDVLRKDESINPLTLYNYIYLFASNYSLSDAEGDVKKDAKRGIYHLAPGLNKGLVKSIKFTKEALANMPEANLEAQGRNGNISDGVYSATIRMIGNSLFKNGIYIYIDTAKMGMGSPMSSVKRDNKEYEALSFEHHIGGYYNVFKVSNDFSSDGEFETILEAKWISARVVGGSGFASVNSGKKLATSANLMTKMSDDGKYFQLKNNEMSKIK